MKQKIIRRYSHLFTMTVIVLLPLLPSLVLFGVLHSSATFKGTGYEFGGPAALFAFVFVALLRWHKKMEKCNIDTQQLNEKIKILTEENESLKILLSKTPGPLGVKELNESKIDIVLQELSEKHLKYGNILPLNILLPTLSKLFDRNSFAEEIEDCIEEDWTSRLRAVCLTEKVLNAYSQDISELGNSEVNALYNDLIKELRAFSHNLTGLYKRNFTLSTAKEHLDNVEAFKQFLPERLSRQKISVTIKSRCSENMKKISELWEKLG